jgi:hypothetical protein
MHLAQDRDRFRVIENTVIELSNSIKYHTFHRILSNFVILLVSFDNIKCDLIFSAVT